MATADLINNMFCKMDVDGDGAITQAEMDAVFKHFDTDGKDIYK